MTDFNAVMDAIKASLAAAMPTRLVQRSLVDPANVKREQLLAGLVCVVSERGGKFATYLGRTGELGQMKVNLVGFVQVAENSEPADIERAELALLSDLLAWIHSAAISGLDTVMPGDWVQSKQLEHPYGWLVLELVVRP
jgi:hypothetical protein